MVIYNTLTIQMFVGLGMPNRQIELSKSLGTKLSTPSWGFKGTNDTNYLVGGLEHFC